MYSLNSEDSHICLESLRSWLTALGVGVLGEAQLSGEVGGSLRVAHHRETCRIKTCLPLHSQTEHKENWDIIGEKRHFKGPKHRLF